MHERRTPARRFRHRRAFWASWFFIRNVLSFRGALAAESAGGSVSCHLFPQEEMLENEGTK